MTTRPISFRDLENQVHRVRNAIMLAEQAFDVMELGTHNEINLISYALGEARNEANQLLADYSEAWRATMAEKRAA